MEDLEMWQLNLVLLTFETLTEKRAMKKEKEENLPLQRQTRFCSTNWTVISIPAIYWILKFDIGIYSFFFNSLLNRVVHLEITIYKYNVLNLANLINVLYQVKVFKRIGHKSFSQQPDCLNTGLEISTGKRRIAIDWLEIINLLSSRLKMSDFLAINFSKFS